MNATYITLILLIALYFGRGILGVTGHKFPLPPRWRFEEKPWFKEYLRCVGAANLVAVGGMVFVFLALWTLGLVETLNPVLVLGVTILGGLAGMIYEIKLTNRYEDRAMEEEDSNEGLLRRFQQLDHDLSLLALEQRETVQPYFCYPRNATPIGYEGSIQYCLIEPYGDTVFAVNPENFGGPHVYPLAENFRDFLRLVLACGSANPVEQIPRQTRDQFIDHLCAEEDARTQPHKDLLELLARIFDLTAMEAPYDYVKTLQKDFNDSQVDYPDEYYETLGIQR